MTLTQLFGYVLLIIMVKMVYDSTRFVSTAKFKGKGIYFITINAWFRNKYIYQQWIKENAIYHWCILFIVALCPTILLLIKPFRENMVFDNPDVLILISMLMWYISYRMNRYFYTYIHKTNP